MTDLWKVASEIIPGFRENREQKKYSACVKRAVSKESSRTTVAILEGETGLGKTLGYLLPAMEHWARTGERILISTHANSLADQILNKDGPNAAAVIAEAYGRKPTIAKRIGMRNYIDYNRVRSIIEADEKSASLNSWIAAGVATFQQGYEIGLELPKKVGEADICLIAASSEASKKHYLDDVQNSKDADVLITNHTLLILDQFAGHRILDDEERRSKVVIADEAHMLPIVAASMGDEKVPLSTLMSIAEAAEIPAMIRAAERLYAAAMELVEEDRFIYMRKSERPELCALATAAAKAFKAGAGKIESGELARDASEASSSITAWLAGMDSGSMKDPLLTASPVRRFPSLTLKSHFPGRIIRALWKERDDDSAPRTVILTSGTLAGPSFNERDEFKSFMSEITLRDRDDGYDPECSGRFAPTRFGSLSFVLADRDVPCPVTQEDDGEIVRNATWMDYAASGIHAAQARGGRNGGRTLVLAASYADAEEFAKRVPSAHAVTLHGQFPQAVAAFKAQRGSILITPTGWEGLDLPGLIDHLVIPRIPYVPVDEDRAFILSERMKLIGRPEEYSDGAFHHESRARTFRKLRQGTGRAIRQASDVATLWIMDPRFPLPAALLARKLTHQGIATRRDWLAQCIPARFREGRAPAFDQAEIYPLRAVVRKAAWQGVRAT